MIFLVIVILLILLISWSSATAKKQESIRTKFENKLTELLDRHKLVLARQRMLLVRKDEYGAERTESWDKEREHFFTNVLLKDSEFLTLFYEHFPHEYGGKKWVFERIELVAQEASTTMDLLEQDIEGLSPFEFEHYCAGIMKKEGWDALVTQASGDQGVDVIASKDNLRVVLQCKKYTSAVGNKAVQEIAAGQLHQQADHAAVVTNATFTSSAKQLASTTGVRLLHVSELQGYARELSNYAKEIQPVEHSHGF